MNEDFSFKNIFKRETKLAGYVIACSAIVLLSLSYALFFQVDNNSENQVVEAGDLSFTYTDGGEITSSNTKCFEPMTFDVANLYASDCSYQFSVQNKGTLKASYTLRLQAKEDNEIETSKLKVILKQKVGDSLEVVSGYPKTISELENGFLLTNEIKKKDILVFSVQIYVDESKSVEEDINKKVSFRIEGSGVVHDNQPLTVGPPAVTTLMKLVADEDPKSTEVIDKGTIGSCTNTFAYDGTVDNNLRYVGANPCNYVSFNGETWRIMGIMNNVDDGNGNKETRLKIVRNETLISTYFDYKSKGVGSSNATGSSDWTDSQLMMYLNTSTGYSLKEGYTKDGKVVKDSNGKIMYQEGCLPNSITASASSYFCKESSFIINDEYKELMSEAIWNLGTTSNFTTTDNGLTSHWYTYERGTDVYDGRLTEWIGSVGLIYPSDFGYATSGGASFNREQCLEKVLNSWSNTDSVDCTKNNYFNNKKTYWTLTPYKNDGPVFCVSNGTTINTNALRYANYVLPAVYLKPDVVLTGGNGSIDNPYTLGIE